MTIERKVGMGIAGQPSGGAPDVAEVFSVDAYEGNSTARSINNGIDLSGEGGMVWIKGRDVARDHYLFDTERPIGGGIEALRPNDTIAAFGATSNLSSFNSNGFSLGTQSQTNYNGSTFVSWTFRKKEKFFDVVTYSGNGASNRQISHSLGSNPAMIIIKATNQSDGWYTYHHSLGFSKRISLDAQWGSDSSYPPVSAASDTTFTTVLNTGVNSSNSTYVAYLFADNSAEDADDQMIKCGIYNGTNSTHEVALGWEPQWLLVKRATGAANWRMLDTMRGFIVPPSGNEDSKLLFADTNGAEDESGTLNVSSNGFIVSSDVNHTNQSSQTYIYMAIRAPMMKKPESATDVFSVLSTSVSNGASFSTGFPYDLNIMQYGGGGENWGWQDRLRGFAKDANTGNQILSSNMTNPEYILDAVSGHIHSDVNTGGKFGPYFNGATAFNWAWKRAKSFFDIVGFTGNGTSGTAYNHSLSVIPEMVILKNRSRSGTSWRTWALSALGDKELLIDTSAAAINSTKLDVTASTFTINAGNSHYNRSGDQYIVYLFATLAGISKVGSYTGNGTSQNINCGFSSGARFILIKRAIGGTGNWLIYDSVRGITSSANSVLNFNNLDGAASINHVQPHSSGFSVTFSNSDVNGSGNTYLFYAIA